jgi:hypothetical protein
LLPCGRRSGKSENAKRKLVKRALIGTEDVPSRYFACAPTRDQARAIFWNDLKALIPNDLISSVWESTLTIKTVHGSEIVVVGLDRPQRLEGSVWHGGIIDEIANVKPEAWAENIRPVLSDTKGWCDLIGTPEGRNHYFQMVKNAEAQLMEYGKDSEWGVFHWKSSDILPPEEIESARRSLDSLSFQQEFEASFINFEGQIYYTFDSTEHTAKLRHMYDPKQPLIVALDFNVAPGVAAICQEMSLPNGMFGTGAIGEVYIDRGSNTPAVCRKIAADWGEHQGRILFYGDATGGSQGSAKVSGSDWELVAKELRPVFGGRLEFHVPSHNPPERSRVNAVNTRFKSADGAVRAMVDPFACPHLVEDLEGVRALKGGSGEIDKKIDPKLTHMCFAAGTMVDTENGFVAVEDLPVSGRVRTWDGSYVDYNWAGKTISNAELVSVSISNGDMIYCTPWHQFLTNKGWVCASDLEGLELKSWQSKLSRPPSRISTAGHTTNMEKSLTMLGRTTARNTGQIPTFTERYGNITRGRFLRECISTTKTAIGHITKLITWNALPLLSTFPTMNHRTRKGECLPAWQGLSLLGLPLSNGMEAKMESIGTRSITKPLKKSFIRKFRAYAFNVGLRLRDWLGQLFAAKNAKQSTGSIAELITKTELAQNARKHIRSTNISKTGIAPEHVQGRLFVREVKKSERADVYCLHVPSDGCFALANGAIVSNSDAFGYYVAKEFPVADARMRKGRARV